MAKVINDRVVDSGFGPVDYHNTVDAIVADGWHTMLHNISEAINRLPNGNGPKLAEWYFDVEHELQRRLKFGHDRNGNGCPMFTNEVVQ